MEETTLANYLQGWLDHSKARVRLKTWERYESMIRLHVIPELGDLLLTGLDPLLLQRHYATLMSKGLSGGSVLNTHLVLNQALAQAVRWGYLPANPCDGVQPPRPKRAELAVIDAALAERILAAAAGTRYELLVAIAIATGMRRGEMLALRWADVADDYSVIQVRRTVLATHEGLVYELPKTRRSARSVVLPAFVRPYLEGARAKQHVAMKKGAFEDHDLVVCRPGGTSYNPDTVSSGWAPFLRRRKIPHVRFHDLRHAHATLMLQQGVHPKIVSERLGHASIGITLDTYSHVLPTMQQEAAAAVDAIFMPTPAVEAADA